MTQNTLAKIIMLSGAALLAFMGLSLVVTAPNALSRSLSVIQATTTTASVSLFHTGPNDIYPDSDVTPGALNESITQGNISQNICNPKWSTKSIRPTSSYTTALKKFQLGMLPSKNPTDVALTFGEYQYELPNINSSTSLFEEDHLVSLELGGNPTDPANLWPEPYHASIPDGGAKNKDAVENYLHKQVCASKITLIDAQRAIAADWYRVYRDMVRNPQALGGTAGTVINNATATDPDDD